MGIAELDDTRKSSGDVTHLSILEGVTQEIKHSLMCYLESPFLYSIEVIHVVKRVSM
jgi:hypothetical protein